MDYGCCMVVVWLLNGTDYWFLYGCCMVVVWLLYGLVLGNSTRQRRTGEPSRRVPVCRPCTRGFEERGVLGPFTCGFGAGAVCERAADAAEVG